MKLFASATKSASDSSEELNFQYPGPLLKLFMLILTLTSLWSECEKPSMLLFVIFVRDVSQKNVIYSSCSEWCWFRPCVLFSVWMVCSPDVVNV